MGYLLHSDTHMMYKKSDKTLDISDEGSNIGCVTVLFVAKECFVAYVWRTQHAVDTKYGWVEKGIC
jgi:hypothetical protein